MKALQIHPNNPHLLGNDQGVETFLLGDTAWQLLQRLSRDEILYYLDNRAAKGFNLVCTVFLPEFDGLRVPNAEGQVPLLAFDPIEFNDKYLDLVHFLLSEAEQRGITIGLLPTWGDKMTAPWGTGPRIFDLGDEAKCFAYAHDLATHLKDHSNILWVLGGDRPANLSKISPDWPYPWEAGFTPETDWEPLWRAMSEGISEVTQSPLFAFHPQGGSTSSSQLIHQSAWLDLNMIQSGHGGGHDVPIWEWIARDYALEPAKPTMDAEPNYEDHPVNPWPVWDPKLGFFDDYDVRKQCYRSVFAGGCGVVYGHHCVWQFWNGKHEPVMWPKFEWKEALDRPGAVHVGLMKKLIDQFGSAPRIPDQSVFPDGQGVGSNAKCCLRTEDGRLALVYVPSGQSFTLMLPSHSGRATALNWLSPVDLSLQGETFEVVPGQSVTVQTPNGDSPDIILRLVAV